MRNNQREGKCYRLRLITLTETLIIPDITKTESNKLFYYTSHSFFLL